MSINNFKFSKAKRHSQITTDAEGIPNSDKKFFTEYQVWVYRDGKDDPQRDKIVHVPSILMSVPKELFDTPVVSFPEHSKTRIDRVIQLGYDPEIIMAAITAYLIEGHNLSLENSSNSSSSDYQVPVQDLHLLYTEDI